MQDDDAQGGGDAGRDAGNEERHAGPGRKGASKEDSPTEGRSDGGGNGSWTDNLAAVAEEAMGSGNFRRLVSRTGDLGGIADLAVAAQLDDLRLIEKARFHRARRDAGRALALGDKPAAAAAGARVADAGADLALLRLQRDVASHGRTIDAEAGDASDVEGGEAKDGGTGSRRRTRKPSG